MELPLLVQMAQDAGNHALIEVKQNGPFANGISRLLRLGLLDFRLVIMVHATDGSRETDSVNWGEI
jgi:hypothetical protein